MDAHGVREVFELDAGECSHDCVGDTVLGWVPAAGLRMFHGRLSLRVPPSVAPVE